MSRSACLGVAGLYLAALLAFLPFAPPVAAQSPDTALVNGNIITLDEHSTVAEALAVRDGKIVAVGRSVDIRDLAGPATRVIDLGGHTVIPGLIDSHMHAIRAALFYATEVNWIGTRSIAEAMARIAAAARAARPGQWIIVAGGWTEQQFAEGRRPSQAELVAAAPDHPVYIQLFYSAALLNPAGFKALNLINDSDVAPRGKIERDATGNPTGWITGDNPTITALFDRLPLPSFDESVAGTRQFFRELNRLGLTGVSDPGGFNLTAASYLPLFRVWQDRALTVRVVFSLFAQRPGKELEDYQNLTQMLPMGFGDDMLRFNGIGENVAWGMFNNDSPTEAQKQQYYEIAKWAASRGMTLTQHWNNDISVHDLLDVFERVNRETPIAGLRWSIAHLNDASVVSFQRMKALGVGWLMQDAMYFGGDALIRARGPEIARHTPPIRTAMNLGIQVGGGTDAHRVMSYNPFVSLQWMIDGRTVVGTPTRDADELPSREEALRLYTQGSAWFTHDDGRRGALTPGRLADLAVLTKDFMNSPTAEIGGIESLLTMVGGRIVYAAEPFAALEEETGK
ncbi:MAG TPA: amidohydrolase [Xanthobacteraceae bacterium]|nr:amidohydrolase [Xanthobacteraceae bacterium]